MKNRICNIQLEEEYKKVPTRTKGSVSKSSFKQVLHSKLTSINKMNKDQNINPMNEETFLNCRLKQDSIPENNLDDNL